MAVIIDAEVCDVKTSNCVIERPCDEAREILLVAHVVRPRLRYPARRSGGDDEVVRVQAAAVTSRCVFHRKLDPRIGAANLDRLIDDRALHAVEIVVAVAVNSELERATKGRDGN